MAEYIFKIFVSGWQSLVPMMLNIIAEALAPSTESEKSEFFLVIATGLTAISLNNPKHRIIGRKEYSSFYNRAQKLGHYGNASWSNS